MASQYDCSAGHQRLRLRVQHRAGEEHQQDDRQQDERAEVPQRRQLPQHREERDHADGTGDRRELVHVAPRHRVDRGTADGDRHDVQGKSQHGQPDTDPPGALGEGALRGRRRSAASRRGDRRPAGADQLAGRRGRGDASLAAERVLGGVGDGGQRVHRDRGGEERVGEVGHRAVDACHRYSLPAGTSCSCTGLPADRSRSKSAANSVVKFPESLRASPPTDTTVSEPSAASDDGVGPQPQPAPAHAERAEQAEHHRAGRPQQVALRRVVRDLDRHPRLPAVEGHRDPVRELLRLPDPQVDQPDRRHLGRVQRVDRLRQALGRSGCLDRP